MSTPMHFHATMSSNRKTGRMLVTTTSENSCPNTCKHKQLGTCYASFSWIGLHWKKVSSGERSMPLDEVLQMVRDLPEGSIYRWNQAGDLMGEGNKINSRQLLQLVDANRGKRGFTYTHKPLTPKNLDLINYANSSGFAVNISCDSVPDALILRQKFQMLGYAIPITVTVPEDYAQMDDNIKICPAQIRSDISCIKCQWCAITDRKFVVAFKMHGSRRKKWET